MRDALQHDDAKEKNKKKAKEEEEKRNKKVEKEEAETQEGQVDAASVQKSRPPNWKAQCPGKLKQCTKAFA